MEVMCFTSVLLEVTFKFITFTFVLTSLKLNSSSPYTKGESFDSNCIHPSHPLFYHLCVSCSCPTLCNPMDCRLPGSAVHGTLQPRILEWVAIPFSICYLLVLHYLTYMQSNLAKCQAGWSTSWNQDCWKKYQ